MSSGIKTESFIQNQYEDNEKNADDQLPEY